MKNLIEAVRSGDYEQAKTLLEQGADPNTIIRGHRGEELFFADCCVIIYAIANNDLRMVKLLVHHGAEFRKGSLSNCSDPIAIFFLRHGLNANSKKWNQLTEVMVRDPDSLHLGLRLLHYGADPDRRDYWGNKITDELREAHKRHRAARYYRFQRMICGYKHSWRYIRHKPFRTLFVLVPFLLACISPFTSWGVPGIFPTSILFFISYLNFFNDV